MAKVKLLGIWHSPFTHRVKWALKLKGVDYEYIEEDPSNRSPLLLQSNPIYKKTPVLIHNDKSICTSLVILEYIDENFPKPSILPKDSYDRALARFWANFLPNKVSTVYDAFLSKGREQKKSENEVCEMLKILDNELKDKKFFVANKFGFADIVANMVGFWLGVLQEASGVELVTSEKFPNFCAWRDEYVNCSQVKEHLPSRKDLVVYYKAATTASTKKIDIIVHP